MSWDPTEMYGRDDDPEWAVNRERLDRLADKGPASDERPTSRPPRPDTREQEQ